MANTVDKVIKIALAEEGYQEKSREAYLANPMVLESKDAGAGEDNYTKYARDMHKIYPSVMDFPASWCFTEDSYVLTIHGYKSVKDIIIGDMVMNAYGTGFNKVTMNIGSKSVVGKLKTYGTFTNTGTLDHPVLSAKRKDKYHRSKGFKKITFRPMGEITKGDICIISNPLETENIDISDDLIWLLGYYCGDGYKNGKGYRICANDIKLEKLKNKTIDLRFDKMYDSRTCYEATILNNESEFIDLINDCGIGAEHKRVPSKILFASNRVKKIFLDGYLDADGCDRKRFSSISKELILGISKIVFDIGYSCSVRKVKRKTEGIIFDTRTNEYRTFKQHPFIYCGQINYRMEAGAHTPVFKVDSFKGVSVRSFDICKDDEMVYTISTDGDHTYTANNLAVHNCDCYVDWCFMEAYGMATAKSLLGGNFDDYTVASADMYKRKGAWYTSNPQVGDQIFFQNSQRICHTGLVIGTDSHRVYTIEGNTSPASGVIRNGGGVYRKSYELNHPRIAGYGRPNYDVDNSNNPSPTDIASGRPLLRRGSLGDEVKKLQANLNSVMGENLEVDGVFGGGTQRVLQSFQTKYGLEVDGVYGRGSETKMRELLYK